MSGGGFLPVLGFAKQLVQERARPGDCCVDATAGNGVDTTFLAGLVGPQGTVYGFDIQQAALENTRTRLTTDGRAEHVRLVLDSHARMADHIPAEEHGQIAAVMFNLGYLPGGDHTVITAPGSTIEALNASFRILRPGGVITAVLYTGHPGGAEEVEAVCDWAGALDQKYAQVIQYRFMNTINPPFLTAVIKMK